MFCAEGTSEEPRHVRSEVSPAEHAIRRRFVRIIMPEFGPTTDTHLLIHNKQVLREFGC